MSEQLVSLSRWMCVQTAFEILSFASVVSNCWLLLLSPRLQELYQESRMSGTNIVVFAVMVEVRGRREGASLSYTDRWGFFWHLYMCVLLQHVLIIVKLILAFLIPDEPEWVRQKRERIEYTSMQALKQQVSSMQHRRVAFWCCPSSVWRLFFLPFQKVQESWLCFKVLSCCFLSSGAGLQAEVPSSVLCGPQKETDSSVGPQCTRLGKC